MLVTGQVHRVEKHDRPSPAGHWNGARPSLLILLLAVAGCGGGRERPAPPPVQRQAALPPSPAAVEDATARRDRFCATLTRIVDEEPTAFHSLRGAGGGEAWEGALVPAGLRGCRVEGDYRPAATYVCRGESAAGGSGDALLAAYRAQAADVEACLGRPTWYPSLWRRGQDFEFAGGERQTIWRDGRGGPGATVALKVEEDLATRVYFLRLAVASER